MWEKREEGNEKLLNEKWKISFLFTNYSLKTEDDLLPKIGSKETFTVIFYKRSPQYNCRYLGPKKKTWMPPYFGFMLSFLSFWISFVCFVKVKLLWSCFTTFNAKLSMFRQIPFTNLLSLILFKYAKQLTRTPLLINKTQI